MKFQEKAESLKARITAKISTESTADEVNEINSLLSDIDELSTMHNEAEIEKAKFKEACLSMVLTHGNNKEPQNDSSDVQPKTFEEIIAEKLVK